MARILHVAVGLLLLYTAESCCPDGWFRFQESCYLFENQKESWYSAVKYCEGLHGHLVTLETDDEYKFMKSQLLKMNRGGGDFESWTSGNDIEVEDIWVWNYTNERGIESVTCSHDAIKRENWIRVTINYWGPGEPSHGTEDCLGLYNQGGNFFMNDAPCDYLTDFICEIENTDEEVIVG